jgi:xanthine/uracil permease
MISSFAYLPPTFSIIFNSELQAIEDDDERFKATMQVISGALLVVGFTQVFIGYSGAFVPLLKYITPVTVSFAGRALGLSLSSSFLISICPCRHLIAE